MSIFLVEFEFTLNFATEMFLVPFEVRDQKAVAEQAYAKTVANMAGQKEQIGAILVRDRVSDSSMPPIAAYVFCVHRLGPMCDLPAEVGKLVGSFSSHQGRHSWHVFAPRTGLVAPTLPGRPGASPTASEAETGASSGAAGTRRSLLRGEELLRGLGSSPAPASPSSATHAE